MTNYEQMDLFLTYAMQVRTKQTQAIVEGVINNDNVGAAAVVVVEADRAGREGVPGAKRYLTLEFARTISRMTP